VIWGAPIRPPRSPFAPDCIRYAIDAAADATAATAALSTPGLGTPDRRCSPLQQHCSSSSRVCAGWLYMCGDTYAGVVCALETYQATEGVGLCGNSFSSYTEFNTTSQATDSQTYSRPGVLHAEILITSSETREAGRKARKRCTYSQQPCTRQEDPKGARSSPLPTPAPA
jgi:hypothetical protein